MQSLKFVADSVVDMNSKTCLQNAEVLLNVGRTTEGVKGKCSKIKMHQKRVIRFFYKLKNQRASEWAKQKLNIRWKLGGNFFVLCMLLFCLFLFFCVFLAPFHHATLIFVRSLFYTSSRVVVFFPRVLEREVSQNKPCYSNIFHASPFCTFGILTSFTSDWNYMSNSISFCLCFFFHLVIRWTRNLQHISSRSADYSKGNAEKFCSKTTILYLPYSIHIERQNLFSLVILLPYHSIMCTLISMLKTELRWFGFSCAAGQWTFITG